MKKETYPQQFQDAIDKIEKKKQELIGLFLMYKIALQISEEFKDTFERPLHIEINWDEYNTKINLMAWVTDLKSLTPIRRRLRQLGLPSPMVVDHGWMNARSFHYDDKFVLEGHLPGKEGDACRYIKVGERPEPIYKLVCGEEGKEGETNETS